ncbi:MAG TPA: hypothetical protein VIQ02_17335 [Jiangellaceae bacterium]
MICSEQDGAEARLGRGRLAHCLLEDAGLREVWPLVYQKKTCGPAG